MLSWRSKAEQSGADRCHIGEMNTEYERRMNRIALPPPPLFVFFSSFLLSFLLP